MIEHFNLVLEITQGLLDVAFDASADRSQYWTRKHRRRNVVHLHVHECVFADRCEGDPSAMTRAERRFPGDYLVRNHLRDLCLTLEDVPIDIRCPFRAVAADVAYVRDVAAV